VARTWTPEQAASLAPAAAALKAAQGLGSPRKWTLLGRDSDFIWGLAQGSGAQPYQVQIDLTEPAFKCSCPSRKFPCKHGLGLLLLHAAQPDAAVSGSRPEWVNEWVAKRADRTAKQEARAAAPAAEKAPDPAAQEKRREKRAANVAQGVASLDSWLRDLVRQGIAATTSAGYAFWDVPARRLIDAQAPGLARRVRELGSLLSTEAAHEDAALVEIGRLHLLLAAHARRAYLPPAWQDEVDAQIGLTAEQDELRQHTGIMGTWFVGAQTVREEDKLIVRVSHLYSGQGRTAKIFEFATAARPAVASIALGRWFDGELVFFPGVESRRAVWKSPPRDSAGGALQFLQRCEDVQTAQASALAVNPLAEPISVPVHLTPVRQNERWWLRDTAGAALAVHPSFALGWELAACSGGQPLNLFGTWDGFHFTPLTALTAEGLLQLSPRVGGAV
jgi:hypothetical protein